jgi:hypothetical protein
VTRSASGTRRQTVNAKKRGADTALYAISVASDLTGVDAQMLRVYERRGLLTPERTDGAPAATARTTSTASTGS